MSGMGPQPILRKLVLPFDYTSTSFTPGFWPIFTSFNTRQGPDPDQVGTGSAASSITWGNTAGWTSSTRTFCNAALPDDCSSVLALFAPVGFSNLETVSSSAIHSTNYDLGRWTFHGTGFIATPFIVLTSQEPRTASNVAYIFHGSERSDGSVPAVPLLGILGVAGGVIALGALSARRR